MHAAEKIETPRRRSVIVEIIKFSFVALLIITPFRLFIAQPFIVSGASMEPTFNSSEYLVVDQISYRFEKPERGDVIIFRYPLDPAVFFIKRIVGLPGETIDVKNGAVFVSSVDGGQPIKLNEPYLSAENMKNETNSVTLEQHEYFVLGDNRKSSSDSRVWGPLQEKFIIGRALMRLLPIDEATLFPGSVQYFE